MNQIELLGIEDHVTYLDLRNDVYRLYSLFDVFYLPSWYEGLAVVAVESQTANLPLLMSEYITDEAVIDECLAKRIGITERDMEIWASETEQIYSELLQGIGISRE